MSVNWYYRRIIRLIGHLGCTARQVIPANRSTVDAFMTGLGVRFVERVMCGLRQPHVMDHVDWDHDPLLNHFREYIDKKEERMREMLQAISYHIDEQNTLGLVTGYTQPEKVSDSQPVHLPATT